MDVEVRRATEDDYRQIMRVDGISFGLSYTDQDYVDTFEGEPPEFLVAIAAGRVVGVTGAYRFAMSVPGGDLQVPGVTWVSVLPTHRRRGVLRALMEHQLATFAADGEPAAVLTASEGGIYRRFGYGPATQRFKSVIDRRFASLRDPVDTSDVEFMPAGAARVRVPELHRRWRELTPGGLSRSEHLWDRRFEDRESRREGMSELFYLVHPDGYLAYRASEQWTDGHADNRCVVVDYCCASPKAHAALWQVLLGMDLFVRIESWELPADDPLPLLLSDPRQVRIVARKEGMWLRPVEVCTLLASRCYRAEFEAVIEVDGERFSLAGGPDGATCQRTDSAAEARFELAALGSAYLGGHRVHVLARAGQVQANDPVLLDRLDVAFSADREADYGTGF